MPNDADFVKAMREEPESDATLLIYADWLEEQGQASRANLIRVQVEQSRREGASLLVGNETRWRADELPKIPGLHWSHFDRGMVWSVTVEKLEIFVENAPAIFRVAPIIGVHDRGIYESKIASVADSPHFALVRWLRIDARRIYPHDLETLAQSPYLSHLKRLELRRAGYGGNPYPRPFSDQDAQTLAASPFYSNLESLALPGNHLSDEGLRILAESPRPCALKSLNLWQLRPEEVRGSAWFRRSPRSRQTYSSSSMREPFTQAGIDMLLMSPRLPNLMRVDCDWSRFPMEYRDWAFQTMAERTRRSQGSGSAAP